MTTGTILCACGQEFRLLAHRARHQPRCLGPEPTILDLYRIGNTVKGSGSCIVWRGKRNSLGYGILPPIAARQLGEQRAHRAAWALANSAAAPKDLGILHSCDTPACINPKHLRPGSQKDNASDMDARGRHGGRFQRIERERRTCPVCGAEHLRRPGDRNITCSLTCAARQSWVTAPTRNQASPGEERSCSVCGENFRVERPSIRRKTCGRSACVGTARWQTRRA